jgi:hypothetical protein
MFVLFYSMSDIFCCRTVYSVFLRRSTPCQKFYADDPTRLELVSEPSVEAHGWDELFFMTKATSQQNAFLSEVLISPSSKAARVLELFVS